MSFFRGIFFISVNIQTKVALQPCILYSYANNTYVFTFYKSRCYGGRLSRGEFAVPSQKWEGLHTTFRLKSMLQKGLGPIQMTRRWPIISKNSVSGDLRRERIEAA